MKINYTAKSLKALSGLFILTNGIAMSIGLFALLFAPIFWRAFFISHLIIFLTILITYGCYLIDDNA